MISTNYKKKLAKINYFGLLEIWKTSLLGKITALKSPAASQLVYVLTPSRSNRVFFKFLLNDKIIDKIKRLVMINDYPEGGLKMTDISSFNKSLKATWIKKYMDTENYGKWKIFFNLELVTTVAALFLMEISIERILITQR